MMQFKTGILNGITLGPLKYLIMLTAISSHLAWLEETGFIPEMNIKYKWPHRLAITGTPAFKSIFKQYFSEAKLKAHTQPEDGEKRPLWMHRLSLHTEETGAGLAVS